MKCSYGSSRRNARVVAGAALACAAGPAAAQYQSAFPSQHVAFSSAGQPALGSGTRNRTYTIAAGQFDILYWGPTDANAVGAGFEGVATPFTPAQATRAGTVLEYNGTRNYPAQFTTYPNAPVRARITVTSGQNWIVPPAGISTTGVVNWTGLTNTAIAMDVDAAPTGTYAPINSYTNPNGGTASSIGGSFFYVPHMRWTAAGAGAWGTAANWNFGPQNILPYVESPVTIAPATAVSVTGPAADATVKSLALGGGAGAAELVLQPGARVDTTGALALAANGTLRVNSTAAPAVGSLAVAGAGRIDVKDSGLVDRNGASGAAGQAATRQITALLKTGLENGGNFDLLGPGISSTEANADNATAGSFLFALGVVQNNLAVAGSPDGTTTDETAGNTIYTTFKGRTVALNDTLVRYTYMGDADLSGDVTSTDYSLIDAGFGGHLAGWVNGDFDHSGDVNSTDYALIDNAFGAQTGVLPEQVQAMIAAHTAMFGQSYVDALAAVQSGVVPEPATTGVLALAGVSLLARRRRR